MTQTYLLQQSAGDPHVVPVAFSSFADGDTHCVIKDVEQLTRQPVLIVHPLYPNQNEQLVRLLLLVDLLRDLGIKDVSVFTPYLPYSRQDKRHVPGEALGARSVCRMLARAGCTCLYVVDCHFMRGQDEGVYEGLRLVNVAAIDLLLQLCQSDLLSGQPFHVVGPDKGAALLGESVGHHLHKTRGDYGVGDTATRDIVSVSADHISLEHQTIVIVDDMVSTGGTMLRAAKELQDKGAEHVYCVCTHGLFLGDSFEQLCQTVDGVIVGDTVPHTSSRPIIERLLNETVVPHWLRNG